MLEWSDSGAPESLHIEDFLVIPAKAGIQLFRSLLDPDLRRGEGIRRFLLRPLRPTSPLPTCQFFKS
jgi:hypothetical protein